MAIFFTLQASDFTNEHTTATGAGINTFLATCRGRLSGWSGSGGAGGRTVAALHRRAREGRDLEGLGLGPTTPPALPVRTWLGMALIAASERTVLPLLTNIGGEIVPTEADLEDGSSQMCPICHRECDQRHRLGLYWRKFGYAGPPYCALSLSLRAKRDVYEASCPARAAPTPGREQKQIYEQGNAP